MGDPRSLSINEWLADAGNGSGFIELFNPDPLPVELGGLFLTGNPAGSPTQHALAPLSFMAAPVMADNKLFGVIRCSVRRSGPTYVRVANQSYSGT